MNVPTWLASSRGFRPVVSDHLPNSGPDTNWHAAYALISHPTSNGDAPSLSA